MTAEFSAGDGGERAVLSEHETQLRLLAKTIGEPVAVMRGDEIVCVGLNHGVRDSEAWIRNGAGELDTYAIDEFTFLAGEESEVARYFDDSGNPSAI